MYALKVFGLSLDLFGHHIMPHLERFSSMCGHSTNFWSFWICGCVAWISSVTIARSFAYVVVVHVVDDTVKWSLRLFFSNNLSQYMMPNLGGVFFIRTR